MAQKVTGFINYKFLPVKHAGSPGWSCIRSARCKHYGVYKGIQRAYKE